MVGATGKKRLHHGQQRCCRERHAVAFLQPLPPHRQLQVEKPERQKPRCTLRSSHYRPSTCRSFRTRTYNETNVVPRFASSLQGSRPASGGDNNLSPLDRFTPTRFDGGYFATLRSRIGLLHSDQELFNNGSTDRILRAYRFDPRLFAADFARCRHLHPLAFPSKTVFTCIFFN